MSKDTIGYTGHVGSGGLQGHSIGGYYPFIVYGQETEDGLRYGVLNGATGFDTGPVCLTAWGAHETADKLKRESTHV